MQPMQMPVGDVVPELALVVGGVGVLLYALFTPRSAQSAAGLIALGVVIAAGVLAVRMLSQPQILTFHDTFARDGVALWGKLIILGITAVTIAFSFEWFRKDARHGEYYTLLLFSALGAALLAGASELMELIVAILLSSVTSFVLAAYHRQSTVAGEAAIKYYLVGALANGALLYGAALLFGLAGTTTFTGLQANLQGDAWAAAVGFALVALAVAFKMGAVPAHAWMPDVAQGAPAPIAAFLTVAAKVGALIALGRLVAALPEQAVAWRPMIALLSAATMTLGNLAALWQDDVRRLLGWSAVSQTGYGLMAIVALGSSELAVPALLFFLLAYALANLAAFGVVIELRGLTERAAYTGLARTRPLVALALVLAFLSFIGIPPLAGFTAKLLLFGATIEAGYTWLAVLAIANTVVSIAYYARVVGPAYFEAPARTEPQPVLGRWSGVATGIMAAGVVVAGIGAEWLLRAFEAARLLPWP